MLMDTTNNIASAGSGNAPMDFLEYLVADFLETGCFLKKEKYSLLLDELRRREFMIDSIEVHPAFSIGGVLIPVMDGPLIRECWLFYPHEQKIDRCHIDPGI